MPYFSKNGSIPKPTIDDTPGWVLVPNPPAEIPEGKQLVWLNWEWVIRDPRPVDREGYQWNWNHNLKQWVELEITPINTPLEDEISSTG
jgi:hypothetical protein